jgi:hypothetical protein
VLLRQSFRWVSGTHFCRNTPDDQNLGLTFCLRWLIYCKLKVTFSNQPGPCPALPCPVSETFGYECRSCIIISALLQFQGYYLISATRKCIYVTVCVKCVQKRYSPWEIYMPDLMSHINDVCAAVCLVCALFATPCLMHAELANLGCTDTGIC